MKKSPCLKPLIGSLQAIIACGSLFALTAVVGQAQTTDLLSSSLSAGSLDTTVWTQSQEGFPDATVSVTGSAVTLMNGETIASKLSFSGPLTINASVELLGANAAFNLLWNSAPDPITGQQLGFDLFIPNESQLLEVGIDNVTPVVPGQNEVSFPEPLDTLFDIQIVDTGSTASVYIDGSNTALASFSYTSSDASGHTSGSIALNTREDTFTGGPVGAGVESLTVTGGNPVPSSVPDATGTLGLLTLSVVTLAAFRRRYWEKSLLQL